MTDKAEVTREELMAMREVARKAWLSGRGYVPGAELLDGSELRTLSNYLDANVGPLPAPEPQLVKGPSGATYWVTRGDVGWGPEARIWARSPSGKREGSAAVVAQDVATVANLLVPFEDVVRATLEEMGITKIGSPSLDWTNGVSRSWVGLSGAVKMRLPAILKRLESR